MCYIKITTRERQLRSNGGGCQQWRRPASYSKGSGLEMYVIPEAGAGPFLERGQHQPPRPICTLSCPCASWGWTHTPKAHNLSGSGDGRRGGRSALPGGFILPTSFHLVPLRKSIVIGLLHSRSSVPRCHYTISMTSFFSLISKNSKSHCLPRFST